MPDRPAQPDPPPVPPTGWLGVRRHIPNALVGVRLVMAGVFVWLLSGIRVSPMPAGAGPVDWITQLSDPVSSRLWVAAAIFILAALTDTLDGLLARKWSAISKLGRIVDPFADKVLVLGGFVMLAGPAFAAIDGGGRAVQLSGVLPWMVVVILAREMLVTSIRGVFEGEGVDFSAGWAGKLKMVLQSVGVPAILLIVGLAAPLPGSAARGWIVGIAWATVVVTVLSGVPYVTRAVQMGKASAGFTRGLVHPQPPSARSDAADEPEGRIQRVPESKKAKASAPRKRVKRKKRLPGEVEKIEIPATHTRSRSSKGRTKATKAASSRKKPPNQPPNQPPKQKEDPTS